MTELEQELVDKGYWKITVDGFVQTSAKWGDMMKAIFDRYGFNIIVSEKIIKDYIMVL